MLGPHAGGVSGGVMQVLYPRCCALDVHKATVVACLRLVIDGKVVKEVRTFETTTASLMALSDWLADNKCTHIAMEATGVYWKPVWHILAAGDFELVLANAAHVKNVPGRKTDVSAWLRAEISPNGCNADRDRHVMTAARIVRGKAHRRPRRRQHQAGLGDPRSAKARNRGRGFAARKPR